MADVYHISAKNFVVELSLYFRHTLKSEGPQQPSMVQIKVERDHSPENSTVAGPVALWMVGSTQHSIPKIKM